MRHRLGLTSLMTAVLLSALHVAPAHAVVVGTAGELAAAVQQANAGGDKTIVLRDGVYTLDQMLWITATGMSFSSQSGNRDSVTVQGHGMSGGVTHVFGVNASGFSVRNMTLRGVSQHAIQLQVNIDSVLIQNLHILDTGEQMVKIPYDASNMSLTCDNGIMEQCLLEYSAGIGPQWYIGGIDAHNARNWIVRDNTFVGIRSPADAVAEHAIHFWSSSQGTLVERNTIINCDRGIGFGLGDRGHVGGIIRNNMIYHNSSEGFADVSISLESAPGAQVSGNTIWHEHSFPNAIEYRFAATTGALIADNLTNRAIARRDGASATVSSNVTSAQSAWFVNPPAGNLHLSGLVGWVVDQGETVNGLTADFDRDPRPQGAGIDIGADEYAVGGGGCGLTCPADITVTDADDDGSEVVTFPDPATTGSCGAVTSDPPSGYAFPLGTTTVGCASSQGGGSCSFTVTVLEPGSVALQVISCSPAKGKRRKTIAVVILGAGFLNGATASLGGGVFVSNPVVTGSTQIGLTARIGRKAKRGPRDVAVTNPGGERAVCRGCFSIK